MAMRTALLPLLVVTAVSLAIQFGYFTNIDITQSGGIAKMQAVNVLLQILNLVFSLWIAVAWHRFILLEETPRGYWPAWHGRAMLSYFGHGLLIAVCLLVLALPLIAVGFYYFTANPMGPNDTPWLAIILAGIAYLLVVGVAYRLVPMLPAAAIDRPIRLREAWAATAGHTKTFVAMLLWFVLVFIVLGIVFAIIIGLLGMILITISPYVAAIILAPVGLLLNVMAMLFGVTLFTTIYGHFIEGRALD